MTITPPSERTLVLVAGSGRSGTSLFSGILQRLGYYVPQPEVPPDETNPMGFAESQWVVDFHTRLLDAARVGVSDARPAAWADTAKVTLDRDVVGILRSWLAEQYGRRDHILIKDPRLGWFLPLWRRVAEDLGAAPRLVTMLRHPAAVVDSKQRYYGGRQDEAGRAAGWLNQMLFTERATREAPRAFVRYDDLLKDWTQTVSAAGEQLDLSVVRDAPAQALRRVHGFVDPSLSRSRTSWDELRVPESLRTQADEVWELVNKLADGDQSTAVTERLDEVRSAYVDYYTEAESVAYSSIVAFRRPRTGMELARAKLPQPVVLAVRMVPVGLKRRIPRRFRLRIAQSLARGAGRRATAASASRSTRT